MELYVGTGGYSNDDWLGLLYPMGTKSRDYLKIYAQHFNAVELNSSFYATPGLKAFAGMVKNSQAKVRFSVKAHQSISHTRDADENTYQRLLESVAPLKEVGMLGPFLLQFPYSFHRTADNRRYLKTVIDSFKEEKVALEFRHYSWDNPQVREACQAFGVSWVSVDYPELSGLPKSGLHVTSEIAYLRLHGRNKEKWWDGKDASERHDYRYTPDELRPFVEQIKANEASLDQVYLMMQNTTKGHALYNLQMLKRLFAEFGIDAPINW
jgi:uncharacterized protein YecE (DUF72 family)